MTQVDGVDHVMASFLGLLAGDHAEKARQANPLDPFNVGVETRGTPESQTGSFAHDLLVHMGYPVTPANIKAISAWIQAEGTQARFNPLATTQKAPGASNFNSVGVKNFVDYNQGLDATSQVLHNGKYEPILAALRDGTDPIAVARAIAQSPWGTGNLVLKVLGASPVDNAITYGGSNSAPAPAPSGFTVTRDTSGRIHGVKRI